MSFLKSRKMQISKYSIFSVFAGVILYDPFKRRSKTKRLKRKSNATNGGENHEF